MVRIFAGLAVVLSWLGAAACLAVVVVGPEGKGVTVDGAWVVVILGFVGAVLAFLSVVDRAPGGRTVLTSAVALCLGVGALPLLFALAEGWEGFF